MSEPATIAYAVVTVDSHIIEGEETEPFLSVTSPLFPTEEEAEKRAESKREAYRNAEERDEIEYNFWEVEVCRILQFGGFDGFEQEDEESHRLRKNAANAVAAGMLDSMKASDQ